MRASNRIIVNTLAQYIRTILNMLLSLISARLVLNLLGVTDYGIYSLVAGVVTMLSFFTNSLVASTQRFLSIHQGKGDITVLKYVFSNSLLLHIFIGLGVLIILEGLTPFLFGGWLNIPIERETAGAAIYQMVVMMVYISFIAAPYRALLISRENIVYTSVIDVCDGILKVVLVVILYYLPGDKLVDYGWIMLGISCFNFIAFAAYSHIKYEECVRPRIRDFNKKYLKEVGVFTGWVTYSSLCIAMRNQGLAIVLNRICGAAINAAYGIGLQIVGMVSFVSTSLGNAIAPQLIAAKGSGENQRMWFLAEIQSKFSYLLLAMIGIPTMFAMQPLLELWLVEVPPYTQTFACMFLASQIVDMVSTGLATANRAMGNIGKFTLITYTPKFLILPLGWYALRSGWSMIWVAIFFVAVEALCMFLRIPLMKGHDGFNTQSYCGNVIFKSILPTFFSIAACTVMLYIPTFPGSFLLMYAVSIPLFIISAYKWSLSGQERIKAEIFVKTVRTRFNRYLHRS